MAGRGQDRLANGHPPPRICMIDCNVDSSRPVRANSGRSVLTGSLSHRWLHSTIASFAAQSSCGGNFRFGWPLRECRRNEELNGSRANINQFIGSQPGIAVLSGLSQSRPANALASTSAAALFSSADSQRWRRFKKLPCAPLKGYRPAHPTPPEGPDLPDRSCAT
jgi:hypothetical protein